MLSLLSAGPDIEAIPVGVVVSDATPIGSALQQGPLAALEKDDTLRLHDYADEASLRSAVEDGKVDGGPDAAVLPSQLSSTYRSKLRLYVCPAVSPVRARV